MNHYSQIVAISFIVAYSMFVPTQTSGQFQLHLSDVNFTQWRRPRENCSSPLSCAKKSFVYIRICFTVFDKEFRSEKCRLGNTTLQLSPTSNNEKPLPNVDRITDFIMRNRWLRYFSLVFDFHADNKPITKFTSSNRILRINALHNDINSSTSWYTLIQKIPGVRITYSFRFICEKNYYGSDCKTLCKPSNDSLGHYRCSKLGKRICLPGWSGDYCDVYKCEKDCHMICKKSKANCECAEGWTGSQCNKCKKLDKCVNGYCSVNGSVVKPCECHEGWGGPFCQIDLHYCVHHKGICNNNGNCYNTKNPVLKNSWFTCRCNPGFTGITCEKKQCNSSHPTPCQNNGKCMQDGSTNAWSCVCPPKYFGSFCELNASQCAAKHCPESGTVCQTDINDTRIRCVCPPGRRCGNKTDYPEYCETNPCLNGGTCESVGKNGNGFRCICPEPLSGNRCQFNKSQCKLPCQNSGVCRHTATRPFCFCNRGYTGNLCQCPPCLYGDCVASMSNGVVQHRCSCRGEFYGPFCNRSTRTLNVNVGKKAPVNIFPTVLPPHLPPPQLHSFQPTLTVMVAIGAVAVLIMLFTLFYCCRRLYRHRRRTSQANNYIKNNRPTTIQNDLHSPMTLRPDSPISSATVHPQTAALSEVKKPLDDKLDHLPPKVHNTADQSVNLLSDPSHPFPPGMGANLNAGPNTGLVWPLSPSLSNGKKTAVFLSSPERRRQGGNNWFSSVNTGHATQV